MIKKIFFISFAFTLILIVACANSENSNSDVTTSAGEVAFDLSDARAFFLQEENVSYSSSVSTNFQKLLDDGTIVPAFSVSGLEDPTSERVSVRFLFVSPTDDIHVMFASLVTVKGTDCRWVVIGTDNDANCVDSSVVTFIGIGEQLFLTRGLLVEEEGVSNSGNPPDLARLEFDASGNAYYHIASTNYSTPDEIRLWDKSTSEISVILDAEEINLNILNFLPLTDGSLVIDGDLQGTEKNFFRFVPSSDASGSLQELCVDGSDAHEPFFVADDGSVYVVTTGISCPGATGTEDRQIWRGTLTGDGLDFTVVDSGGSSIGYNGYFFQNSAGNLYFYDYNYDTLTSVNSGNFGEIGVAAISYPDLIAVHGDYLFETGTDGPGNRVFIRKHLLGEREEIDLLGGANLLVQQFDVAENGDVYFGALDLSTTTVYLYKYNNETGELEQLSNLPSDLGQIILL